MSRAAYYEFSNIAVTMLTNAQCRLWFNMLTYPSIRLLYLVRICRWECVSSHASARGCELYLKGSERSTVRSEDLSVTLG